MYLCTILFCAFNVYAVDVTILVCCCICMGVMRLFYEFVNFQFNKSIKSK